MENLYDYLFHYNPFEKQWHAFKREDYNKYFNGEKGVTIRAKEIEDLITEILVRTSKKKK